MTQEHASTRLKKKSLMKIGKKILENILTTNK